MLPLNQIILGAYSVLRRGFGGIERYPHLKDKSIQHGQSRLVRLRSYIHQLPLLSRVELQGTGTNAPKVGQVGIRTDGLAEDALASEVWKSRQRCTVSRLAHYILVGRALTLSGPSCLADC